MSPERRLPNALRTPQSIEAYTERRNVSSARREFNKADGVSPFPSIPQLQEILERHAGNGQMLSSLEVYPHSDMDGAKQYLKDYIGLKDAFFELIGGGSDAAISKVVHYFSHPIHKRQIWGVSPHFPGIVRDVLGYRPELKDGAEEIAWPLMYAPIITPLNKTLEDGMEMAMEARRMDEREVDDPTMAYMYYLCIPGTPKGDIPSMQATNDFIRFAESKGDMIFIDAAFGLSLPRGQHPMQFTEKYSNVVCIDTFSKVLKLPGLGVGMIGASKEIGEGLKKLFRPYEVSGLEKALISQIVKPEYMDPYLDDLTDKFSEQKRFEVNYLRHAGIEVYPTSDYSPIYMVNGKVEGIKKILADLSVDVVDCSFFLSTHPDLDTTHLRFLISSSKDDARVALRRIVRGIEYAVQDQQYNQLVTRDTKLNTPR